MIQGGVYRISIYAASVFLGYQIGRGNPSEFVRLAAGDHESTDGAKCANVSLIWLDRLYSGPVSENR